MCVFILKAAVVAIAESNFHAPSSPSSPRDDRKMLKGKVLKAEMYRAKATFFSFTQDHWNVYIHHSDMTNGQGCSAMIQKCIESVSVLKMASLIKQMYFVNTIPKHRGEIHKKYCFPLLGCNSFEIRYLTFV